LTIHFDVDDGVDIYGIDVDENDNKYVLEGEYVELPIAKRSGYKLL
jgi:hypothetical protein